MVTRRIAAVVLAAGLAGGALAAPAAHAATAAPARTAAAGSIFGPCTSLQAWQYRWFGKLLYECVYIKGLGGWYWVRVSFPGCAATGPARETAAC